jgi:predicted ferric reductase
MEAYGGLWWLLKPVDISSSSYTGQLFGALAVWLMSLGLILISTLQWVEEWFHGIDRAVIWHRRVAISGLLLLVPHIIMASSPEEGGGGDLAIASIVGLTVLILWAILPRLRAMLPKSLYHPIKVFHTSLFAKNIGRLTGGYERWRMVHRLTGLFLAAGFIHGVMDGTPFTQSPILYWSYLITGGLGLLFYVYREVLARFFMPLHDYQVHDLNAISHDTIEISLSPLGKPMKFVPGQFAMIYIEAKDGWHRHPFTIASAPKEKYLRITVKALGDFTSQLKQLIEPGMPAIIGGPHGRFDRRKGTRRQVWIGAGIGIAPFLSWLRSLEPGFNQEINFYYTTSGEPPFAAEIREIASKHPSIHTHFINSRKEKRLTTKQILADAGQSLKDLTVFICGPQPLLQTFQSSLRRAGVPRPNIRREYFDWR